MCVILYTINRQYILVRHITCWFSCMTPLNLKNDIINEVINNNDIYICHNTCCQYMIISIPNDIIHNQYSILLYTIYDLNDIFAP